MADIRISPQGYVYGEEPLSDHPFWEDGPAGADQYVKEVTGSSTTEGTVTTYDIKYKDQDDVSHDVISIPVDSAGGGSEIPGEPNIVIGTLVLAPQAGYRMDVSTRAIDRNHYVNTASTLTNFEDFVSQMIIHPITEDRCIVDVDLNITLDLRNTIAGLFDLAVPGPNNQFGSTVMHLSRVCNYTKSGDSGTLNVQLDFYLPFTARQSSSSQNAVGWIGYFYVEGQYNLAWT